MRIYLLALVLVLMAKVSPARAQAPYIPDNAEDAEGIVRKPFRIWVRAEYMIWWIKTANFPPLVTTGDISDPAPGALNSLSTSVLFGGSGMDFRDRQGGRFTIGVWLDDDERIGLAGSYFFLTGRAINQSNASPGNPPLANPFFNVLTGVPDSSLATFPGIMSGTVFVDAPTFLQSVEINFTADLLRTERLQLEALTGVRYANLSEGMHITESSLVELAPQYAGLVPFDGNTITLTDRFDTHNHFFGGQLGLRAELRGERLSLGLSGKVALGVSHEIVSIHGFTGIDTQPTTAVNGGLYAVSSNSGRFTRDMFAVVPEVGLNLGYQLTDNLRVFAGYTFLYWSNVARPGDQIDTNVNTNFVPTSMTFGAAGGPSRPAFAFRSSDFFAHGVNVGLELRY